MFKLTCKICNKEFEAITLVATCCSAKCRQRKYRSTTKGKQQYTKYNQLHYKRPKKDLICVNCGDTFRSARKTRTTCDKPKCKSKTLYLAQLKQRNKNPQRARANDLVNKRIQRGISLQRKSCSICGKSNAEAHHENYDKPLDITWLCKQHHEALHSSYDKSKDISNVYRDSVSIR